VVVFAAPLKVTVAPAPVVVSVPEITAVTESVTEPVIPPCTAEIEAWPMPAAVAIPLVLTVAAAVFAELQVAVLVRFWELPSLKVPVAVNCSVNPMDGEVFGAVTLIDCKVGAVTVSAKLLDVTPP
jgi:hypothetical protein